METEFNIVANDQVNHTYETPIKTLYMEAQWILVGDHVTEPGGLRTQFHTEKAQKHELKPT